MNGNVAFAPITERAWIPCLVALLAKATNSSSPTLPRRGNVTLRSLLRPLGRSLQVSVQDRLTIGSRDALCLVADDMVVLRFLARFRSWGERSNGGHFADTLLVIVLVHSPECRRFTRALCDFWRQPWRYG